MYRDDIEPEFAHIERFLPSNGVFVDVGANTGIYSLRAAKYLTEGTVVSIEPLPEMFAMLNEGIRVNRFKNVRIRNLCLADYTGSAELWVNNAQPTQSGFKLKDPDARKVSSLVATLDDLVDWEGLDRLDYLKIDVNGTEQSVLSGATRTLDRFRPVVQVDIHNAPVGLDTHGYRRFQAPASENWIFVPNEHPSIELPSEFGWIPLG